MCVWVTAMARRVLKLKVTGQGQDAVGLTSQFTVAANHVTSLMVVRYDDVTHVKATTVISIYAPPIILQRVFCGCAASLCKLLPHLLYLRPR